MLKAKKTLWAANALRLKAFGVDIGMPSYIGPLTSLIGARNLKIGKRVRIWPGARIELFDGAALEIQDDVILGVNCHITLAADTVIGAQSLFTGANVITNITHSLTEMDRHPIDRPWEVGTLQLGERLFVGHGAKILPDTSLAAGCVVGANAVVAGLDAPANAVVSGLPGAVRRILE